MNSINCEEKKYLIDPKKYRADRKLIASLMMFWFIWTFFTLFMTYYVFYDFDLFAYIWLVFGYIGVIYVPYFIYNKNRIQIIMAKGDLLIIYGTGVLPYSKLQFNKKDLKSISLERKLDDENNKVQNRTLNINFEHKGNSKSITLAPLLHPRDQQIIFE